MISTATTSLAAPFGSFSACHLPLSQGEEEGRHQKLILPRHVLAAVGSELTSLEQFHKSQDFEPIDRGCLVLRSFLGLLLSEAAVPPLLRLERVHRSGT